MTTLDLINMSSKEFLKENFYIITGGPGVGKTSLLAALENSGFVCIPEAARQIIQEQMQTGGDALPWGNTEIYRDLMLDKSIADYLSAGQSCSDQIIFFDRGIPDTLAYSYLINLPVSEELGAAAQKYKYNQKVFILPPWEEIYQTDNERKQDFEEAVRTYEVLGKTYQNLGYELIEIPKMKITERAEFIIKTI